MTQEEKAKAYDEALKKSKAWCDCEHATSDDKILLKRIFPELKESEDEKIRKEILNYIKTGTYHKDWIVWLEKQGAKVSAIEGFESEFERQVSGLIASAINKEHEYNQGYVKWAANALLNYAKHELEKQDEQKTADKVETKFKIGDWIVFNGLILYVKDIVMGFYRTISIGGIPNSYDCNIDNAARLWTIKDAKDGDVLATSAGAFIYNGNNGGGGCPGSYCGINTLGRFQTGVEHHWTAKKVYPATKEQRDILFQKMKEKGYKWDFEKKELKKIEQNPTEDEKVAKWVIDYIGNCPNESFDFYGGVGKEAVLSWLNKLKDILQLQPKKDSTDRFFEGFKKGEQSVIENYGKYGLCKPTDNVEQKWKPTDKDIFELQCVINNEPYNGFILKALLEQLKKLK